MGDAERTRPNTVFVVGAGASYEAGLPVGDKLKKTIATKLDLKFEHFSKLVGAGDPRIYEVLRAKHGNEINEYLQACWAIRDGVTLSPSIDDFIDTHQGDPRIAVCGKLAIARSIAEAENASKLSFSRDNIYNTINFEALESTWYQPFFRWLHRGIPRERRNELFANVTIICFNYDRCIEHFLVEAIAAHFLIPKEEARTIAGTVSILHPYGTIGDLHSVEFGAGSSRLNYDSVMSSLRTYTEQVADTKSLAAIKSAVLNSETLIFLGFAFHPNNMAVLWPSVSDRRSKRIFFTRHGVSDQDTGIIRQTLIQMRGGSVPEFYSADTCAKLFDEYKLGLRALSKSPNPT
ncbi:MAG: SIR2 family protein [Usitatibacter sp.]